MKNIDYNQFVKDSNLDEKYEGITDILRDFVDYIEGELEDEMGRHYDRGYQDGNENGYDVGWQDGRADAYDEGHQEGYEEGYADAKRELPGESAIKEAEERGYKRAILEGATPDVTELI